MRNNKFVPADPVVLDGVEVEVDVDVGAAAVSVWYVQRGAVVTYAGFLVAYESEPNNKQFLLSESELCSVLLLINSESCVVVLHIEYMPYSPSVAFVINPSHKLWSSRPQTFCTISVYVVLLRSGSNWQ